MTEKRQVALVADDDEFFRMAIGSILADRLGVAEVIEVGSLDDGSSSFAGWRGRK